MARYKILSIEIFLHDHDVFFLSNSGFNTFGFLAMVLTAFNAISLISNNNNNNNDNNNNNVNDNNNNNVNINEGTNMGNIEDSNNMVNLPPAPGGRKFRLKRMALSKVDNTNTYYCKDQENIQKALSRMALDVVDLMPSLQKICINEQKNSHHCILQLHCTLKTRSMKYHRETFPEFYTKQALSLNDVGYRKDTRQHNFVNKRIENGENGKNLETNQRKIKLFLDIITIAAAQSCIENFMEKDRKKIVKVLMKRIYGSYPKIRNNIGCKSMYDYKCGF